jgi:hypothetical protein
MKPLWISLVNTGIANRFELDDCELIEMNWRLTMYPDLYYRVFQHEIKHDEGKYRFKDLVHDMWSRTPGLFKFMSKHISSWTQIMPCYWDREKKSFVYDISNIVGWVMVVGVAAAIYYILRWMP